MEYVVNPSFKFQLGISEQAYPTKAAVDYGTIKFHTQSIALEDLSFFIRKGNAYMNNFRNGSRKQNDFIGTNIISFDVDDCSVTMEEYVAGLRYQPSICYTTFSDGFGHRNSEGKLKGSGTNCFRLIYCLAEEIKDIQTYRIAFDYLVDSIPISYLEDDCTKSCNQLLLGNGSDKIRIQTTNRVYSVLLDFESKKQKTENLKPEILNDQKVSDIHIDSTPPNPPHINMDVTFNSDFFKMDRKDFIQKYNNILPHPIKYETPYLEVQDEIRYTVAPDYYVCVPRKYGYAQTNLGDKRHCMERWKDG